MAQDDSTLLSSSLQENLDAASLRDPFIRAQQQYQDKMGAGEVLSKSPMQGGPVPENNDPGPTSMQPQQGLLFNPSVSKDFTNFSSSPLPKMMQGLGIDDKGLPLNDLGKTQLIGRLKQKFGESYSDSPQVMNLLSAFDKHLQQMGGGKSQQAAITAGQRTLAALLGGG